MALNTTHMLTMNTFFLPNISPEHEIHVFWDT